MKGLDMLLAKNKSFHSKSATLTRIDANTLK